MERKSGKKHCLEHRELEGLMRIKINGPSIEKFDANRYAAYNHLTIKAMILPEGGRRRTRVILMKMIVYFFDDRRLCEGCSLFTR